MNENVLHKKISDQLDRLGIDQQQKVLDFARSLVSEARLPVSGKSLLSFEGRIDMNDLELMQQAIENGCEKVL